MIRKLEMQWGREQHEILREEFPRGENHNYQDAEEGSSWCVLENSQEASVTGTDMHEIGDEVEAIHAGQAIHGPL